MINVDITPYEANAIDVHGLLTSPAIAKEASGALTLCLERSEWGNFIADCETVGLHQLARTVQEEVNEYRVYH